jgi:hypothetical protein|tara:strand:- start:543 stop:1121 length:579 start_codon:yes stop_codon:yes gene_type:complete
MATAESFLQGPIPGQSLTDTPGNYPWEKPPQMHELEDVAKYYLEKLGDPEVLDDLSVLFDNDVPLAPFVKTLMQTGFMNGRHTVDAGTLVGPVVHAFLKAAMTDYGIDVRDDTYSAKEKATQREEKRLKMAIDLAMTKSKDSDEDDPGIALLQELQNSGASEEQASDQEPEMEQTMEQEPQGAGLMSKEEQL